MSAPLLAIRDLRVTYLTEAGPLQDRKSVV